MRKGDTQMMEHGTRHGDMVFDNGRYAAKEFSPATGPAIIRAVSDSPFHGVLDMSYTVKRTTVWAGDIMNRPGMLARVLEALSTSGANLEFLIARRVSDNTSRVFVSPIRGKRQEAAARDVGLMPAEKLHTIRIEGPNRPGLASEVTRGVAGKGVNLRGASAAAINGRAVIYLGLSTEADAATALRAIKTTLVEIKRTTSASRRRPAPTRSAPARTRRAIAKKKRR